MDQPSLFAPEPGTAPEKPAGLPVRMRVLITVKAAPNPSERHGETVCVAGLRVDPDSPGWVRMYPINFRELDSDSSFRKYDVVTVTARPARDDPRAESWRPDMSTLVRETFLPPWRRRQAFVADYIEDSMCALLSSVRHDPPARSLAAIRPRQVTGLDIESHPGWTPDEQAKIGRYVSQLELPGLSRGPGLLLRHRGSAAGTGIAALRQAAASIGKALLTGNGWRSSGICQRRTIRHCATRCAGNSWTRSAPSATTWSSSSATRPSGSTCSWFWAFSTPPRSGAR
jgi:hypothetical protein